MNTRRPLKELRDLLTGETPVQQDLLRELEQDTRKGARDLLARHKRAEAAEETETARLEKMLEFEHAARTNGFTRVAGVDEAGRGPLAGPIVAAAVVLAEPVAGLNDSKQLTEAQREELFETLHAGDHAIGVCVVSAEEIDRTGIQAANYAAMARAAARIKPEPDYLLVDGFQLPGVAQPQVRIVKGDARSLSIAAASIVAKVTRDRIMAELDDHYPGYAFARHKGYATRVHLEAIARLGPCPAHRKSFAPFSRPAETPPLFD
jgi:ribonuclease HII